MFLFKIQKLTCSMVAMKVSLFWIILDIILILTGFTYSSNLSQWIRKNSVYLLEQLICNYCSNHFDTSSTTFCTFLILCYSSTIDFWISDINECDKPGFCSKPGRCVNTLGSFKCICPRRFKLDSTGTYCLDADECADDSKCPEGEFCNPPKT